jgi:hypothetical protein
MNRYENIYYSIRKKSRRPQLHRGSARVIRVPDPRLLRVSASQESRVAPLPFRRRARDTTTQGSTRSHLRPRHRTPSPVNHASSNVDVAPTLMHPRSGSHPRPQHLPRPLEIRISAAGRDYIFGPDPSSQLCSTLDCNRHAHTSHSTSRYPSGWVVELDGTTYRKVCCRRCSPMLAMTDLVRGPVPAAASSPARGGAGALASIEDVVEVAVDPVVIVVHRCSCASSATSPRRATSSRRSSPATTRPTSTRPGSGYVTCSCSARRRASERSESLPAYLLPHW